ncbi:MAG: zinc transporter ZitB [Bacteroidetes bacterium RIFCSPLOWO2_02_FULL_36_8]|nr:MAG: zinc transporter ZitB [Bacteroidetes bacterium RIFCSPLOWO2_02_FULL_36_8]OFY68935.1 MAG: zinc transporter ZitB [Bacteroidetes bacterium RIFCSPLOWO2_12_FULL_37_12]
MQRSNEFKTQVVVYLTALTMVVEIAAGYLTNSMALLADGFHMASHVFALGLSWIAYRFSRKYEGNPVFKSGTGKILSLAGYTSAIILLIIAILMAYESVNRFFHPKEIRFQEAIGVAIIGLAVNLISALILHHKEEHKDHNIHAAYIHVLSDTLTSVTAIIALTAGMFWNMYALDAISGILSSIVISKWAVDIIVNSGRDLLDLRK